MRAIGQRLAAPVRRCRMPFLFLSLADPLSASGVVVLRRDRQFVLAASSPYHRGTKSVIRRNERGPTALSGTRVLGLARSALPSCPPHPRAHAVILVQRVRSAQGARYQIPGTSRALPSMYSQ